MARKRVFISFDYDHDVDLKNALVAQSRLPDSPFTITDMSIKTASTDWKANARRRIKGCDVVVVMCGQYTHTATGVGVELKIAQEEKVSYFLLKGRALKTCTKPTTAKSSDAIYKWTWPILKQLIGGAR
ncbi:TIR domain-containing protein [Geodermatophilus sp. SYSU D01186]